MYGGIPEDQSGLITLIHDIQTEEEGDEVPVAEVVVATPLHRTASAETVILNLEEDLVPEATESTEVETLAKESTGGSPRVLKQRKHKTSSERGGMTVSSETIEPEGEPVFKAQRKDILRGKDIDNQAWNAKKYRSVKASAAAGSSKQLEQQGTIKNTLGEVFTAPLTHKTSLYKQFQEEQKALRRDAQNQSYGGKGRSKVDVKERVLLPPRRFPEQYQWRDGKTRKWFEH